MERYRPLNQRNDEFAEPPIKDFSYINDASKKPHRKRNLGIYSVVFVVLLVGVVFLGSYLGSVSKNTHKNLKHSVAAKKVQKPVNSLSTYNKNTTYQSTSLAFRVTYPTTWVQAKESNGSITFTSPLLSLVNDRKKPTESKIVLTVSPQGIVPPAFGGNTGSVAVLNSQIIKYASPSPNQLAQTYVSFVQYPSTTVVGGLDGIYVTGNYGYVKYQPIPYSNIIGISPLITVTFQSCKTKQCTQLVPETVSVNDWQNTALSTPITNIIKSFVFT